MAVDNYTPIVLAAGDCIDQDFFQPAFNSLLALEQASKDGAGDVECVHLSGTVTGNTASGESCVLAIEPEDMPSADGDQICCLILSVSGAMQDPVFNLADSGLPVLTNTVYYPYSNINVNIKCAGSTLSTSEGRGSGVVTAMLDPTICDFSQGLEICVDGTTDVEQVLQWGINWCGCMLCVQCPPLPLEDYYIPRSPSDCEYGLGDFAQIIHVLNQMNAAFRCAGYSVECITEQQLTTDSVIANNIETDTKWIGISCTRVEWTSAPIGASAQANVRMGCAGRPISCNSSQFRPRVRGAAGAEFVSVACGECRPGETLWFGTSPEINCAAEDSEEEEPTGVIDLEGKSDILFFVFRKQINDLPVIPQVSSGCIFEDNADALTMAFENIHLAACNFRKINKDSFPFSGSGGNGDHTELVPAQNWPPPVPPPRPVPDPPPIKKWAILGSAQAEAVYVANLPVSNINQNVITAEFVYQIKCGGAPIYTSPSYFWTTIANAVNLPLSFRVPICAVNVSCPIDQNIEICMFIAQSGAGPNSLIGTFRGTFSGMALCIS